MSQVRREGRGWAEVIWDKARGRLLYEQGLSYETMSLRLFVSRNTIYRYAVIHWPARATTHTSHRPPGPPPAPKARALRRGEATLPALPSLEKLNE
jgi:hypothetical protein